MKRRGGVTGTRPCVLYMIHDVPSVSYVSYLTLADISRARRFRHVGSPRAHLCVVHWPASHVRAWSICILARRRIWQTLARLLVDAWLHIRSRSWSRAERIAADRFYIAGHEGGRTGCRFTFHSYNNTCAAEHCRGHGDAETHTARALRHAGRRCRPSKSNAMQTVHSHSQTPPSPTRTRTRAPFPAPALAQMADPHRRAYAPTAP